MWWGSSGIVDGQSSCGTKEKRFVNRAGKETKTKFRKLLEKTSNNLINFKNLMYCFANYLSQKLLHVIAI